MNSGRPHHSHLACLLLLVVLAGCTVPSQPDAGRWRESAVTALDDSVSAVRTASLVTRQDEEGRLVGRAAAVMLVEAEEQVSTARETFSSQQPPASERATWSEVDTALGEAGELVSRMRVAVVDGDDPADPELEERLTRVADHLESLAEGLR